MYKVMPLAVSFIVTVFILPANLFAQSQPQKVKVNLPTDRTLTVRDAPAGTKIGSQRGGNEGTLVGSVQTASGRTWQQVDFDPQGPDAKDGFVASEFLVAVGMTPPPPPQPADCPQGELPLLDPIHTTGWWGRDHVSIGDGEVHIYCFTVDRDVRSLSITVGDRTGADQCFNHTDEIIPPRDSGWPTERVSGTWGKFLRSGFIPKGVWVIKVINENAPDCDDRYQILIPFDRDVLPTPLPPPPPPPLDQLQKGTRVEVATDPGVSLTVRRTPAGDRVGSQPSGAKGTKVGEPQQASGRLWQQVDFDSDPDGWVAASWIELVATAQKPDCPDGKLPRWETTPGVEIAPGARFADNIVLTPNVPKTFCATYLGEASYVQIRAFDTFECAHVIATVTAPDGTVYPVEGSDTVRWQPGTWQITIQTPSTWCQRQRVRVSFAPR